MRQPTARDTASNSGTGTRPRALWIVAAAALGVVGAWTVLTLKTSGTPADATVAAPAAAAPMRAGDPPPSTSPPAAASGATAVVGDAGVALVDDATIMRLAQDELGLDCAGVAERTPPTAAGFDVTCTNGESLRVYTLAGARPRVGPRH